MELFDWLSREGGIVLSWWALATAAGLAALPLCLRLLGGLPDRGYTMARATGVLLVAFVYWLLGSFGFLLNTTGGMALAWTIVLIVGLALFAGRGERIDLRAWWKENRAVIVSGEILFAALLIGWAVVRAHQNALTGTEKPMELAFISATMRSEAFPPNDPWMSGYAISYYYFGYIMAAMFGMLSGVPSTIAFNMMISLLFALTGLTAFGVVYNMVRSAAFDRLRGRLQAVQPPSRRAALLTGLLGMVFVVLLGNFQLPLIELPYQTGTASAEYLAFWDSHQRDAPREFGDPNLPGWDFWWWFRAARVLNDRNLDGVRTEVIDEFPQFSFLLADVHPHVLALPFAALALGMALNILLTARAPKRREWVLYALVVGGLIFLNTWDGPIYALAMIGAEGLRRLFRGGTGRLTGGDWLALAARGVMLIGLAALFYLPFLASFRSQLGGILPNLVYPTLFQQFFVAFGPLLILLFGFLIIEAYRAGARLNVGLGAQLGFFVLWALIILMIILVAIAVLIPEIRQEALNFIDRSGGWGSVLPALLTKRVTHGLTALVLAVGIGLAFARLFPRLRAAETDESAAAAERYVVNYSPATGFALLLALIGLLLTLAPEFVYLRDLFGTRMNTVFKLYYQAWLLWAVVSAYAVYAMLFSRHSEGRRVPVTVKVIYGGVALIAVSLGMLYPLFGLYSRMFVETGRVGGGGSPLTLDGGRIFTNNADYEAIMCLNDLVKGDDVVVAEAVGGSYRGEYGRTATLTGIPVVFNWPFHQSQWRGPTYSSIAGSREADIDALYRDPTWNTAAQIINRYGIDYIFFGTTERREYGPEAEIKFLDRLQVVCERQGSRYYRVGDAAAVLTPAAR